MAPLLQSGERGVRRSLPYSGVLNMMTPKPVLTCKAEKPRSNSARSGTTPRYPLKFCRQ
jgi:hypothetical protein